MNSIDKHKLRWLWFVCFLMVLTQCNLDSTFVSTDSDAYNWQDIIPGKTTWRQLEAILGEPDKIYEQVSATTLVYTDISSNRPEWFVIDHSCECTIYYRINVLERYRNLPMTLDEVLEKYGEPETVGLAIYPGTPFAFVYAEQGIMILAHPNPPEDASKSTVYAIDYFVPTSLDQYMESFGKEELIDMKEPESFRMYGWEEYEYKP